MHRRRYASWMQRPPFSFNLGANLMAQWTHLTREQQIAQLEKDWAENPRWKGVKRGYSAAASNCSAPPRSTLTRRLTPRSIIVTPNRRCMRAIVTAL